MMELVVEHQLLIFVGFRIKRLHNEKYKDKENRDGINTLHACMIQVGLVKMIYYKHPVKKHQVKHFKKNDKIYIKTNNEYGTSTILGYCKVETLIPMRVLNGNASLSSMLQLYNDDPLIFKNYRLDNETEHALPDIERKNLLIVKTARKMVEEYYEYRNLPHLHDKVWRETLGETDSDYAILLQEDFVPVATLPVTEMQVENQNIRVIKHYFHRRKEASRIHHLLYDIQQAKINCSDGLNEVKCNKLANAVEDIENQKEESFYDFTPLEKKLVFDYGIFDPDIRHDPFEWLRRFERLLRRELQGKMFMFCWQRFCITLWEVPLWIGGIAVILFIS